jgi:ABC-2 type transport system permease protein
MTVDARDRTAVPDQHAEPATTAGPGAVLLGVFRDHRRGLIGWSIALAAVATIYVTFYPLIGEEQMNEMAALMPEDLAAALGYDRLGDAAGYLTSTVFGILGPALLLVYAIGSGARTVAGLEEDGTLELELTHPVSRTTVYVERLAGLWVTTAVLVVVTVLACVLWVVLLDMDVPMGGLAAAGLGLLLLAVAMGTVAFAVGAATGRRIVGVAAGAGLAVVSYLADAIGPMAGADWMETVSPWSWYLAGDPIGEGVDAVGYPLLVLLALLAAATGIVRFRRRDLGV